MILWSKVLLLDLADLSQLEPCFAAKGETLGKAWQNERRSMIICTYMNVDYIYICSVCIYIWVLYLWVNWNTSQTSKLLKCCDNSGGFPSCYFYSCFICYPHYCNFVQIDYSIVIHMSDTRIPYFFLLQRLTRVSVTFNMFHVSAFLLHLPLGSARFSCKMVELGSYNKVDGR